MKAAIREIKARKANRKCVSGASCGDLCEGNESTCGVGQGISGNRNTRHFSTGDVAKSETAVWKVMEECERREK